MNLWRTVALYLIAVTMGVGAYLNQFDSAAQFATWHGIIGMMLVWGSISATWLGYSPLDKPLATPQANNLGSVSPRPNNEMKP